MCIICLNRSSFQFEWQNIKRYWKNGKKYWKSQGILSVHKSGNHDSVFQKFNLAYTVYQTRSYLPRKIELEKRGVTMHVQKYG